MTGRSTLSVLQQLHRLAREQQVGKLSDRECLERFKARRDEDAFAVLVRRHGPMVRGVCRRVLRHAEDAEDVFQATFLVLARKAGSIRWKHSIAPWLYQVAYRLARKVRVELARRREQQASVEQTAPIVDESWREVCSILDKELHGLSEKYRAPLVLCYLEGQTRDEAAERLGWSLGTFKRRLQKGRELLRLRMMRRGVTLPAALLSASLSGNEAEAALSTLAMRSLAQAATAFASKGTISGPHLPAITLAEAALQTMPVRAIQWTAMLLLTLSLAAGAGLWICCMLAKESPQVRPASPPEAARERRDQYGDLLPPGAVARLGTVRLRQPVPASVLAFSADGKTLASGGNYLVPDDRTIYLWDIATGKLLRRFLGHTHSILHIAFSPDGKTFISASRDQTIRFWNVATGTEVRRLRCSDDHFVLSPDGRRLATTKSSHEGSRIALWDPATGEEVLRLHGHEGYAYTLTFSPDGKMLASLGEGPKLFLWDVATGKEIRRINIGKHQIHVRPATFTPDGKQLTTGDEDGFIHLWDVASGKKVRSFHGHNKKVVRLTFSTGGKTLISVADDRTVRFWDVTTGKERRAFPIPITPFSPYSTVFSPREKVLAVGAFNHVIRLWDMDKGNELLTIGGHQAPISSLAFSPDGNMVTSVSWDGTFRRWDARTGQENHRSGGVRGTVISFVLAQDAGGQTFLLHSACLSLDGRLLVVCNDNDKFHLWDAANSREIRSFTGRTDSTVGALALSPDGRVLASGSTDKTVRLWEVATGKELHRFPISEDTVFVLCFSADGRWLAAGDRGRTIRVWEAATGKELHRLRHSVPVFALAFSPDGRTLAAAGGQYLDDRAGDGGIVLWEMATGEKRGRLAGHDRAVTNLSYSRDGRCLASGGADGTVRIWEPFTGKELRRFLGRQGYIKSLVFSPDGRRLASGGMDTTALIWDVGPTGQKHQSVGELTDRQLQNATADLLGPDAGKAYQAMRTLAAAPRQSVPWLKMQLKPAVGVDERKLNQLIEQLDDDTFAIREKAARELRRLGESAEPFLRTALQKSPTIEKRRRIEQLLEPFSKPLPSVDRARQIRLLEVLEQIGTKEATEWLKRLAGGAPGDFLTREAKASLERLGR
ncbi:MAG TPA: sigma-70 family RNA polymerase sigma factor [Gemmataceae bacterium]|nr:sigma-70 family RNA polymerase sigma factor [Gemmataceae bacterium]